VPEASDLPTLGRDIDAVLLDAGGVLVLPDPERIRARLGPLGAAPDDDTCHRGHYLGMREVDRIGWPDWTSVDRVLGRLYGVAEHQLEEAVVELDKVYLEDPWVAVDGAAAALADLHAAGLTLGVVSNASGTMEQMLLGHRICALESDPPDPDGAVPTVARVSVIGDSHVVGVEKPDPRIFEIALAAVGLPAERCLFVGDTVHFDVNGALAAGLQPVHLDPYGLCPSTGHAHVRALSELVELVPARS
jgi:putative hydrolase of the HAD superfamily